MFRRAKLSSKGVSSVKSRVVNLVELQPDLTVEAMKKALISAFEQVYGLPSLPFPVEELDGDKTAALGRPERSFDWRLGRNTPSIGRGMPVPLGRYRIETAGGERPGAGSRSVLRCHGRGFHPRIAPLFTGKVFSSRELGESLSPLLLEDIGQLPRQMVEDLRDFIRSQEF